MSEVHGTKYRGVENQLQSTHGHNIIGGPSIIDLFYCMSNTNIQDGSPQNG